MKLVLDGIVRELVFLGAVSAFGIISRVEYDLCSSTGKWTGQNPAEEFGINSAPSVYGEGFLACVQGPHRRSF